MEDHAQNVARWCLILENAAQGEPIDHSQTQSALDASAGRHRARIVACLRAIDAHHSGHSIRFDAPVPKLELPAAAIRGAAAAEAVWEAYLLCTLGSDAAERWLTESIHRLNPTALRAGVDDNPEPWWANELLILHAFTSFARDRNDNSLGQPLGRCVDFHLAEIQPDHATNEPWAIHAYALHDEGTVTAETLLHAAMVQGSGTLTPVARLVVLDAIRSLRHGSAYPT